jgi:hypothetical protein
MSKKRTQLHSKLFKLKDWLTLSEAARHLSILFGEVVNEADLLRLALDGHLKLSVNFVNHAQARIGKVIPIEKAEYRESLFKRKCAIIKAKKLGDTEEGREAMRLALEIPPDYMLNGLRLDEKRVLVLDRDVKTIRGVWDLVMIGGERIDVEHQFQMMTGGPEVTLTYLDGAFVEREGLMAQIQESYDDNEFQAGSNARLKMIEARIVNGALGKSEAQNLLSKHAQDRKEYLEKKSSREDYENYYPAARLPDDCVAVVRTGALRDLQESLLQNTSEKEKELDAREKITYLNIIGAMLEILNGRHGEMKFSSETALRDFLSKKYKGFKGLTPRTLAEKFALAKQTINEEID